MLEIKTGTSASHIFNSLLGTPVLSVYVNGVVNTTTTSVTAVGSLYRLTLVPLVSGYFQIFNGDVEVFSFVSLNRTSIEVLTDIFDESLGTWEWDKATNALTLFRATGETLRVFEVEDTPLRASRT